jgi:hypothetical protein
MSNSMSTVAEAKDRQIARLLRENAELRRQVERLQSDLLQYEQRTEAREKAIDMALQYANETMARIDREYPRELQRQHVRCPAPRVQLNLDDDDNNDQPQQHTNDEETDDEDMRSTPSPVFALSAKEAAAAAAATAAVIASYRKQQ